MKALIINGSPHSEGHCSRVISIISEELLSCGIEIEIKNLKNFKSAGCTACGVCKDGSGCILSDISELSESFRTADALIVVSPVYYGSPNGELISLLDRLFQSSRYDKRMKVGAAFVTARRGGCTASLDVINKYFSISQMTVATSSYWNLMHTGEDPEGQSTARTLAKNTAFLMKSIALGKEAFKI